MVKKITYNSELLRKCIHLSSSSIAFLLYILGKDKIILPLIIITLFYVLFDYSRKNKKLNSLYLSFFKDITRDNEKNGSLTGASYVLIGITLTIIFFDQSIAIPAILIMSWSDSASAIIGRKFNLTKIHNKTLEGSTAFYLITILIFYFYNFSLLPSIFVALIITFIEYLDKILIDDNLSLPLVSSILIKLFLI